MMSERFPCLNEESVYIGNEIATWKPEPFRCTFKAHDYRVNEDELGFMRTSCHHDQVETKMVGKQAPRCSRGLRVLFM